MNIPTYNKEGNIEKGRICVSLQRQTDDNEIERQKTDLRFISITLGNKVIPSRVQGQDVKKPRVVNDSNSEMVKFELSDAYLTATTG